MKTKSIASILAVLGATVVLNASVLAGPGPQPQFQTRNPSEQKKVTATSSKVLKAPTTAKSVMKSASPVEQIKRKGICIASTSKSAAKESQHNSNATSSRASRA
jgi:hypothetical protein